jgi:hypothetical protein
MRSIYNIYESILDDIDVQMDKGFSDVSNSVFNDENSEMRKAFNISRVVKGDVFDVSGKENDYILNVSADASVDFSNNNLQKLVPGLKTLIVDGLFNFNCSNPTKLTSNEVCNKITASTLGFYNVSSLDGIDLIAQNMPGTRYFSSLSFDHTLESISNCKLENHATNYIMFQKIPKFENVTSSSIFIININRYKLTPTKFWDKKLFEKLFETKYDIEYKLLTNNSINTTSIKSFKDIEKLVKSPEHYSREYLTDAIRLKPGVKITDFIDVSGFMNIEKIQISGDRWGMVFIREKMVDTTKNLKMYHTNMSIGKKYADWSNMNTSFPKTDDGWYVVITRM